MFYKHSVVTKLGCNPKVLGESPNIVKSQEWLGEGAKSGTKKEPKPRLLSLDIFRLGRGLPREGVGAKKFGMSLETREIKLFCRDIPGFCRDIPEVPEKFEKKKFVFNFRSLQKVFWAKGAKVSQESLAPSEAVLLGCNPILHRCKTLFAPLAQKTFCTFS